MSANLHQQLSDTLVQVTEERDQLKGELSYIKDQLLLAQINTSALKSQVTLYEAAQKLSQAGDRLNAKTSDNPSTLFSSNTTKNNKTDVQKSEPTAAPAA